VVIDNRAGAGGVIGVDLAARSAPDGYTLAFVPASFTMQPALRSLPYDPIKSFAPISRVGKGDYVLVVTPAVPARTVKELIAYAKANPGKLFFGTAGVGSVFHLMGELFQQTTGVKMVHLPYKGLGQAAQDLIGGHVPMLFSSINTVQPFLQTHPVKMLAILEPQRFPGLPDVPSITETVPAFKKPSSWFGFFGPAGMPPEIVTRLNRVIVTALKAPDLRPVLENQGLAIIGDSPQEFAALLKSNIEEYGRIIKTAGIEPE